MCSIFIMLSSLVVDHSSRMAESTDLEQLMNSFKRFAIHGDTKATGKEMNGKNWAKLCKDCKIIDGKNVTGTDVDIVFTKVNPETVHSDL
uniref:Tubulin polymerization-promoting protein family member 3 n=1 Tax=Hucho hucho TaxID=62062 RepID=A0A4W5L982_9TELE